MALVRILIDGYSLLHGWPELARGRARHSAAAREALIRILEQYQDATGTPVSLIFDGSRPPAAGRTTASTGSLEVLYSTEGRTADDLIERVVHRLREYGEVLVVTDDRAERETVISLGGTACACMNFIQDVHSALQGLQQDLRRHNREERERFRKRPPC